MLDLMAAIAAVVMRDFVEYSGKMLKSTTKCQARMWLSSVEEVEASVSRGLEAGSVALVLRRSNCLKW